MRSQCFVLPIIKNKKQISSAMLEGRPNYLSNLFVENITKLISYKKTTEEHKAKKRRAFIIEVCQRIYNINLSWTGSCLSYVSVF